MNSNPDFGLLDILNLLEARTTETLKIIRNLKNRASKNHEVNIGDDIVINVGDDHEAFNKNLSSAKEKFLEISDNMCNVQDEEDEEDEEEEDEEDEEEEEEDDDNVYENKIDEQENFVPILNHLSSRTSENVPEIVRNSERDDFDDEWPSSRDVMAVSKKKDKVCFLQQYLKYPEIEYNKPLDVSFSLIYSTRNFYLQLDYSKLVEFVIMFTEIYSGADAQLIRLDPADVAVGEIYAILYVPDGYYYRIQVLEIIDEENVKLIYIDYGDLQIAPKKDLKIILDKFKNMPVFALNCYIDSGWTFNFLTLDTAFLQFIEENQLHYQNLKATFSQPVDYRYPVSLFLVDSDQLETEFTQSCFKVAIYDLFTKARFNLLEYDFELNDIKNNAEIISNSYERLDSYFDFKSSIPKKLLAYIAEKTIGDLSNFLVTPFSEKSHDWLVDNFVTNSTHYYLKSEMKKLSLPPINSLVMIKNNDHFFRAMVLSKKTYGLYEVFAFDIGDILIKETADIYPMVQTFSLERFPPFTFIAKLFKLVPLASRYGQDWSPLAMLQFKKSFTNPVQIIIRSYKKGKFGVDVLSNGLSVSESIKKSKLAKVEDDEDCLMFVD